MNESSACNCIGPVNGEPFCPCMMLRLGVFRRDGKWIEPEKVVGVVNDRKKEQMPFSQKWDNAPCSDFRHYPPMGLYLEPGETYVHICPSCGNTRSVCGANITFDVDKNTSAPEFTTTTESFEPYSFSEDEDENSFTSESNDEIKKSLKVE